MSACCCWRSEVRRQRTVEAARAKGTQRASPSPHLLEAGGEQKVVGGLQAELPDRMVDPVGPPGGGTATSVRPRNACCCSGAAAMARTMAALETFLDQAVAHEGVALRQVRGRRSDRRSSVLIGAPASWQRSGRASRRAVPSAWKETARAAARPSSAVANDLNSSGLDIRETPHRRVAFSITRALVRPSRSAWAIWLAR